MQNILNLWNSVIRIIYPDYSPHPAPQRPFNIGTFLASDVAPTFKHSGNIGDIIFACALLKSFWKHTGKQTHLHLQTDVPVKYFFEHPLKNVMMNKTMADQLLPALQMQPYIAHVTVGVTSPDNAIDLNAFRTLPIDLRCGLIQGWYQLCSDLWLDLFEPWIDAKTLPEYKNTIVLSRTLRLRSDYINYHFLSEYVDDLLYIGLPREITSFKAETRIDCRHMTVDSFDHFINIVNSCRLFIGNQGFAYSVAEAVKCPRVLESNSIAPNNYPLSSNGRIAIFQEQFESFVKAMLNNR